jgi:TRAF3-interacting protein 1
LLGGRKSGKEGRRRARKKLEKKWVGGRGKRKGAEVKEIPREEKRREEKRREEERRGGEERRGEERRGEERRGDRARLERRRQRRGEEIDIGDRG